MNKEQEIRESWFGRHVATLTKHGDLEVLDWKRPGSSFYYCRYVFDGNKIYISGDIGEAVFELTWKADVHSFSNISINYFEEKMAAYHEGRRDFNGDKAAKRLREWVKGLKDDDIEYDHDEMKELFDEARSRDRKWEWVEMVHKHDEFISNLDCDYWEWMFNCGDEIPWRIHGYLIGLQMASEQLKRVEVER